jgi:hypothetical protein|tara:strand:+ start:19086 stop:19289 length:204 start_codon:yes stop_codon:yes gene_type:complete
MTKIIDGFAQPDIEATRGSEKLYVFVETPDSLSEHAGAIKKSIVWFKDHAPGATTRLVVAKPRGKKP